MSQVISLFFDWAITTFILSALLFGVFSLVRNAPIKANGKYIFLKISFLSLPLQYFLFRYLSDLKIFKSVATKSPINLSGFTHISGPQEVLEKIDSGSHTLGWISIVIFLGYISIVAFEWIKLGYSYYFFEQLRKKSRPAVIGGGLIYLHSESIYPIATGIIFPKILFPSSLIQKLYSEEIALLISHEQIHIEKRDPLFNFLRLLVKSVVFFSPFTHKDRKSVV